MRLRKALLRCLAFCVFALHAVNAQQPDADYCAKNFVPAPDDPPTRYLPLNPYVRFKGHQIASLVIKTNGKTTTYKPSATLGLASVYQDGVYVGSISDTSAISNFDNACANLVI